MRVLLTGGGGFLGGRIARRMEDRGYPLCRMSRPAFDITDQRQVEKTCRDFKPDYIVHAAAMPDIGECEREPELARKVNVDASAYLAQAAKAVGSRMIYISSDQVYDPSRYRLLTERTPVNPQNFYGETKVMAEQEVKKVSRSSILRITWQFGLSDARGGILLAAKKALESGVPVRVAANSRRYVTWVEHTVDVIEQIIDGKIPGGLYNVASVSLCTDAEAYRYLLGALGASEEMADRLVQIDPSYADRYLLPYPENLEKRGIVLPAFKQAVQACLRGNRE